jgi:hypothetical protein
MKKIGLIALAAALCGSCLARPEAEVVQQPAAANIDTSQVYTYTPGTAAGTVSVSDADFYRSNIGGKTMGDDYVIYEYVDVRVDKVATLAAQYCYETNPGKSAYLRDIYLQKNHKRRATFDCVDLATR